MPVREKRLTERVLSQPVPLSRLAPGADCRKSARLFPYSLGVHCRDGLSAGANGIRTCGPTSRLVPLTLGPTTGNLCGELPNGSYCGMLVTVGVRRLATVG